MKPDRPQNALMLAFAAVALVFVGATVFVQSRADVIDRDSLSIANNAAPSIVQMASTRAAVHDVVTSAQALVDAPTPQGFEAVAAARRAVEAELTAFLDTPDQFPGEGAAFAQVERAVGELDGAVERAVQLVRSGDQPGAQQVLRREVGPAADHAGRAILATLELNGNHAQLLAKQIELNRQRERWVAFGLDALGLGLTLLALWVSMRVVRRYTELQEAHRTLLERRADEMETFAGRVAHDILSPLNPVSLFLGIVEPALADDPRLAKATDRARAGLMRAKRIVNDLLDFARSGARPPSTARAELDEVMVDLEKELQPEAALAGAELSFENLPVTVIASPGVVTSMVQNLVRNALKYLSSSTVRRVAVRTTLVGQRARVEVEDTGPGLPPGMEDAVFEPYVRAPGVTQPGIGLGLATVKRFATAHGGRIGVASVPDKGCTFWFELPIAELPLAPAPPSPGVSAH